MRAKPTRTWEKSTRSEGLLKLRPANVVARMGDAALPVLNPCDLLPALDRPPAALLCVPVPSRAAIPGLLLAARDLDAVLGLALSYPLGARDAPEKFVDAVTYAAELAGHRQAVFFQAGPMRISSAEDSALEQKMADLARYLDAGFSHVALDASRLSLEDNIKACRVLGQTVMERELSLEVTAPSSDAARSAPEEVRHFLEMLAMSGIQPGWVRVGAGRLAAPRPESRLDVQLISELKSAADASTTALVVEDWGGTPAALLPQWSAAGVRKVDAVEAFGRAALGTMPEALRHVLDAKALGARIPVGELLAATEEHYPTESPERLEALAYSEAFSMVRGLGGQKSARRVLGVLCGPEGT